ncbi:MAG: MoxR family ATPase [Nostoc sp.]|uniref:AAA family ATPase n=1 Tax=unclassified Nostoc TaxID=2593658 RepID=UPI0025DACF97|nr:MoxR family ATPase [Nostoc sp. NMS9]MBN3942435.1 MoxR family ATPase [Nostoc sp. NMS9]
MVKTVARQFLEYTGQVQPQLGERGANGQLLYPYLPNPELVEAVNLAIYLERPLLLKGEPGCGKTLLANAVAYELGLNLEAWYVKSTSRAQDGLYTYDTVGRLRDAQLAASSRLSAEQNQQIYNPVNYLRWGPLGKAFRGEKLSVVLIDEIDKADIDFPNDLLLELDQKRFIVEETGDEIKAKVAPIVLITSNDEKDLPDAFLRRCLFHYVEFPDNERLKEIICKIFPDISPELVDKAVERFLELRKIIAESRGEMGKNVSTSELIDWFKVLKRNPQDEILGQLDGKLPFLGVLLKNWVDHQRYLAYLKNRG